MLELQNIRKTFEKGTVNEHVALDGITLTVADGDFITILGSNGAGKSTLFGAIAGAFWPDCGHILLDGEDLTYQPEYRRARRIGVLFQAPLKGTAPDLTIAENLARAYTPGRRFPLARALRRADLETLRERLAAFGMGLEDRMKNQGRAAVRRAAASHDAADGNHRQTPAAAAGRAYRRAGPRHGGNRAAHYRADC